jgi:vacuolar-type H+-ATPase subunit H
MASRDGLPENDFVDADTDTELSVDSAIALVLDAEQDALATIEQSERQADRIMSETRQLIRGMVRRTEERISRLHSGCAERNRQLVAELEATTLAEGSEPDREHSSEECLAAAADAVARRLTTLENDGVD